MAERLTIGITTRNRPESLARCLASLATLGDQVAEVIVADDSSDVPIDDALARGPAGRTRVIRLPRSHGGYIAGRNQIVRQAATEAVLLMDDDAALFRGGNLEEALRIIEADPRVGAVACAMAEADGSAWPTTMQPAPVDYTCYVGSFIGFAHVIRRSVFQQVGGYREAFGFYGEEKDFCLRMMQAGFDVVYEPGARVIHTPDPAGRDRARYVRHVIRNDCLFAFYNEPLPLPLVSVPVRLARYFTMIRGVEDSGGFGWIVSDLARRLPSVLVERRAVSWSTFARWRRVARTWPAVLA